MVICFFAALKLGARFSFALETFKGGKGKAQWVVAYVLSGPKALRKV